MARISLTSSVYSDYLKIKHIKHVFDPGVLLFLMLLLELGGSFAGSLYNFVEFASIEPNPPTRVTIVDFDTFFYAWVQWG